MESLQLSQVLADLSNLGAAEPQAANAIVTANTPVVNSEALSKPTSSATLHPHQRPSVIKRAWSSEEPKVDKFGRRILVSSPSPRPNSTTNSTPGTPRRSGSPVRASSRSPLGTRAMAQTLITQQVEDDLERASTLMALYDIRSKLKQQDNSSLMRAREKVNALAAKQQAQQAAERNLKAAEESRRNRYSFPKSGS